MYTEVYNHIGPLIKGILLLPPALESVSGLLEASRFRALLAALPPQDHRCQRCGTGLEGI